MSIATRRPSIHELLHAESSFHAQREKAEKKGRGYVGLGSTHYYDDVYGRNDQIEWYMRDTDVIQAIKPFVLRNIPSLQTMPSKISTSIAAIGLSLDLDIISVAFAASCAFGKAPKALDIGCGNSQLPFKLLELGFNVIGVDFCESVMKTQSLKIPQGAALCFHKMDVCKLDFPVKSFDIVIDKGTANSVACGVDGKKKRAAMVAEVWRVLKPGGLYFSVNTKAEEDIAQCYLPWIILAAMDCRRTSSGLKRIESLDTVPVLVSQKS